MATVILLLGAIMSAMGGTIVTAAFPILMTTFDTTPAVIAWVALSNTLIGATLITIFGRLADMHGRKRPYALGIAIYAVGSVFCGLSTSVWMLVFFRVVQSIGAALISANSLAYLVEIYPRDRRGALVGWWEAAIAIGIGAGPVIGGLLLGVFDWPSLFYVNVPFAIVMLAMIPRFMVETHRPGSGPLPRFDFAGAGLFAVGLTALLYGLIEAAQHGWTSPVVLPSLAFGVVCAVAFVWVENRVAAPMINLSLFHDAGFSAGNLAKVFAYLTFSANGILLPFYLYRSLNMAPSEVGLALTLFPIGMLVSSLVIGPLSDRIGTRILAPLGVLLQLVAAIMLAAIQPEQGFIVAAAAMLLGGVGIGTFIAPNDSAGVG